MFRPAQKKAGIRISAAIFLVLAGYVIVTGCLGTITFPGFRGGQTHLAENEGKLSVYFLEVGQGDSALFLYENKTLMIDAGEIDMGDRVVSDLTSLGVTRIDLLVASHPHSDHIGGMLKVLEAFPVGKVLDTGFPHPSPTYEHLLETIDEKHIPYQVAEQGQTINVDPALRVVVLAPPDEQSGENLNTDSIVLRISYGTMDFLMTGDLDNAGEDALLRTGYPLDAEILKVGHHGSSFSTSPAFLDRVHPEMAIISVGGDNPYGHPHAETMDLLERSGVTVYRTDLNGTILVRTDGMSYSVKTGTNISDIIRVRPTRMHTSSIVTGTPALVFTLPTLPGNATIPLSSVTLPPFPENWTIPVLPAAPQIGNASWVYISATRFDAPGDDRQNLNNEWVRLTNRGEGLVLLAGWTLSDRTGSHPYVFPAYILMPGSSVTVYSGKGTMNGTALFMGLDAPLWSNTGDEATLKDGSGNIIDQRS
ncbi:MAG: lamin tail domain-containing protein [Methanoregula sp.]|jgi:beta-lactamase superfamily II metal-dependent hydrolase